MKHVKRLSLVALAAALAGCAATEAPRESLRDDAVGIDLAARTLVEKMLVHPQFSKNYAEVKSAKKGRLPVLCQSPLRSEIGMSEARPRLRVADDTVRVALFDTGLFDVKDDEASAMIKARIVWGADGGIENAADLLNSVGGHEAPDFIVSGDLLPSADADARHTCRLRVAIHNLKTGLVVWEGICPNVGVEYRIGKPLRVSADSTRLALEAFAAGNWSLGFSLSESADMDNPEIRRWLGKCYDPFVSTPGFRISKDYFKAREHYARADELTEQRKGKNR